MMNDFPVEADVVVIGAGAIGCSAAFELVTRGLSVVTIDGNPRPFLGMSASAFGSLTPFSDPFFVGEGVEYANKGVQLYRDKWLPALGATSESVGFTDLGLLQLCDTPAAITAPGYQTLLTQQEALSLEPNLSHDFSSAILHAEPWFDTTRYFGFLETFLRSKKTHAFVLSSRVLGIELSGDCCQTRLDGALIKSKFVLVANGLSRFEISGIPRFPLKWIRGDAVIAEHTNGENLLTRHVYFGHGFITPRTDGRLLLGATYEEEEEGGGLDRKLEHRDTIGLDALRNLLNANFKILSRLTEYEVQRLQRGWRPTTPDELPLLGALRSDPRVVVANGFIGLGVTMAPAVAQDIADYICDQRVHFPRSFLPDRLFLSPTA